VQCSNYQITNLTEAFRKKSLFFFSFFWVKIFSDILTSKRYSSKGALLISRPNLIKTLGAYLGAFLSQVNRVRRLNKRLRVYKIGPDLVLNDKNRKNLQRKTFWQSISEKTLKENNNCFRVPEKKRWRRDDNFIGTKKFAKNVFFMRTSNNFINHVKFELEWNTFFIWSRKTIR